MPVDMSASIYAQYERVRKRAEEAEKRGSHIEAANAYRQCAELMRSFAQYPLSAEVRQQRLKRATAYQHVAIRLEKMGPGVSAKQAGRSPAKQDHLQADVTSTGEDDYEAEIVALVEKTNVRWDDIGGLEDAKRAIKSAYGQALARKPEGVEIHTGNNFLFYGPPGSGKTLLAAATAGSLEATFFNVKVSNVLSKYFGESSKLITALYTVGRRMSPAVIFLDEFESLTPPRGSGESGAERRIISTLLAELDGLATKNDPRLVITIAGTNFPWMLDFAILRRFQQRMFIPLPDVTARLAILDIHLKRRGHKSQVPMVELAERCEGFSGSDIEQLCQKAITRMIERGNPDLLDAVDKGQDAVSHYKLRVLALTKEDFDGAFAEIKPVTTPAILQKYTDWNKQAETK